MHATLNDDERVNRCALADASLHEALDALYRAKGLRFLGAYPEGEMVWTTQVNPVFAIEEMKFYEVTDWMTFPGLAHFVTTFAGSPALWEALDGERQALVKAVFEELHPHIFEVQRRFNRERLDRIRARKPDLHVVRLDAAERTRFHAAAAPVRQRFFDLAGPSGARLHKLLERAIARCDGAPGDG